MVVGKITLENKPITRKPVLGFTIWSDLNQSASIQRYTTRFMFWILKQKMLCIWKENIICFLAHQIGKSNVLPWMRKRESIIGVQWGQGNPNPRVNRSSGKPGFAEFPTGTVDPRVGISQFHCTPMIDSISHIANKNVFILYI